MIPKKKPSGLAKKVPAIFEGLPDIEELGKARAPLSVAGPEAAKHATLLIETGVSGIKAILAKIDPKNCSVLKTSTAKWPAPAAGTPEPGAVKAAIEKCLLELGVTGVLPVRLLIRAGGIYMSKTEKPDAPASQMKDALIWQLAEKLTFPVERSEICFQENQGAVTVAAMDIEVRDAVLESFHAASLHPEKIIPLPVLYESLQQKRGMQGGQTSLVLDLSEDQVSMLVFSRGRFQVMREAPYGYEQVVKAMKGTLMVDNAAIVIDSREAEALLSEFGLPTPNLAQNPQEPKLSQLSARIRPVFEKVCQEVRSTLVQFQKMAPSEKIEEICLSGVGEGIKGLDQYLANQLNMPVRRLDLKQFDSRLDAGWAGVFGLGLTGSTAFNFAAAEDSLKPRFEKAAATLKRVTFLSVLAVAVLAVSLGMVEAGKKRQFAKRTEQFTALTTQSQKIAIMDIVKNQITGRRELYKAEMPQAFHFGAIFREITHLVPSVLLLTKITYDAEPVPAISFTGKVVSGTADPDGAISDFLKMLNNSPFFGKSGLESRSVSEEQKSVEFTIRADLVPPVEGA